MRWLSSRLIFRIRQIRLEKTVHTLWLVAGSGASGNRIIFGIIKSRPCLWFTGLITIIGTVVFVILALVGEILAASVNSHGWCLQEYSARHGMEASPLELPFSGKGSEGGAGPLQYLLVWRFNWIGHFNQRWEMIWQPLFVWDGGSDLHFLILSQILEG